jgi:hypothetical protein
MSVDKISVGEMSVDKMTCCLFPIEFNEGAETLIIQEKVIWDEMIEGIKSYLAIFSINDCKFFSIDIYINSSLMSVCLNKLLNFGGKNFLDFAMLPQLTLATLDYATHLGFFLFVSCSPKWPRQVGVV